MSFEQQPINDYENTPGKLEEKIDDSALPTTNNPVTEAPSASDKAQADIKSLRGEYGQSEQQADTSKHNSEQKMTSKADFKDRGESEWVA